MGQSRAAFGERAFAFLGVKLEQGLGQNELEDGVAQKLQPLIARAGTRMILDVGKVRQRAHEQHRVAERVAQALLQEIERRQAGFRRMRWHNA